MLIPKFIFWEFKIHNGVTAVLASEISRKLLLKFKVVTSLDKYLWLVFTASDSTEIGKGSLSGLEKIVLNLQLWLKGSPGWILRAGPSAAVAS